MSSVACQPLAEVFTACVDDQQLTYITAADQCATIEENETICSQCLILCRH